MALKKSQLYSSLWQSCDEMRGGMDASQYKDYILTLKNKDDSLKTFDFAVANPPFSLKAWTSGFNPNHDEFKRFDHGVPPAKNGDFAFLLHVIASLKSKGKAAVILPHGVLFRGHKEAAIRRNLIARGLIKGIIGLPANLFYGTGIPACVVAVDKENAQARAGVFMIDASKGFIKDGNKNRLRSQDIHKIVDVFNKQTELPRYSRMVPVSEIADPSNDYNLNIPRYIDSSEPEDLHDLDAHLNGGIPKRDIDALQAYWDVFPGLRDELFEPFLVESGKLKVESSERLAVVKSDRSVKERILAHPDFAAFRRKVTLVFKEWRSAHKERLRGLKVNDVPKQIIHELSEDLLIRFREFSGKLKVKSGKREQSPTFHSQLSTFNYYDVYQRLMDYWSDVMQDDVYLIAADGWLEAAKPRGVIDDKEKKIKEIPDLIVKRKKYKMDLIPPPLIVARYFADEQAEIDALQAKQDEAAQALEEYTEEHAVEEGLLEAALNDKGKVTKGGVVERLKQLKVESGELKAGEGQDEEEAVLRRCLELMDAESDAKKAVKDAQEKLDADVLKKYGELSEVEIKALAVDDKWLASIQSSIEGEVNRITQRLAARVLELDKRYANPLPELDATIVTLSSKVTRHLKRMGVVLA